MRSNTTGPGDVAASRQQAGYACERGIRVHARKPMVTKPRCCLSRKQTNFLYDSLSKRQAALLIQLRAGHARLNRYLQRMGHLENNTCGCGTDSDDGETVEHFLFHCPEWNSLRQEIKLRIGSRYGDTSYALGGRSRKVDMEVRSMKLNHRELE